MRQHPPRRLHRFLAILAVALTILLTGALPAERGHASPPDLASMLVIAKEDGPDWVWPLERFRLEREFVAPPHRYGPGHRGIDLRPLDDAAVRTPAAGTVAFAGQVAGRGVLTIDHGDGLVTTFEPIVTDLRPGTPVARSDAVGEVGLGGHASPGSLHFGVRLHGEYVNPLLMLGGVPRAVLLPCC